MDEGVRSVGPSGVLVKKNSSGCLIVRKKPKGLSGVVGSSSARKVFEPKDKKRSRLVLSDSGSSDEIPPRANGGNVATGGEEEVMGFVWGKKIRGQGW
ncbi:hypothetical protein ACFX2I_002813 [Malus domestica]